MKKAEVANDLACFRNGVRKVRCGKHSGEEEVLVTCNPTLSITYVVKHNERLLLLTTVVCRNVYEMTSLFFGRVKNI